MREKKLGSRRLRCASEKRSVMEESVCVFNPPM